MSCFGFATLMMRDARPGKMPRAGDHLVGAFHRLNRHDGLVLHGNGLADVEPGDLVRYPVAEREVLLLFLGRRPSRQHAGRREQRREERGRVHQLDAVFAQHVGDRADDAVRVSRHQLAQDLRHRPVRCDAERKDLGVLDLAGHDRVRDARLLEQADAGAELPERDPVNLAARPLRRVGQFGERLFLRRDDGDVVAGARAASRTRNGNRPLPAMSPRRIIHRPALLRPAGTRGEG